MCRTRAHTARSAGRPTESARKVSMRPRPPSPGGHTPKEKRPAAKGRCPVYWQRLDTGPPAQPVSQSTCRESSGFQNRNAIFGRPALEEGSAGKIWSTGELRLASQRLCISLCRRAVDRRRAPVVPARAAEAWQGETPIILSYLQLGRCSHGPPKRSSARCPHVNPWGLTFYERGAQGDWRGISRHYVTTRTPTQVSCLSCLIPDVASTAVLAAPVLTASYAKCDVSKQVASHAQKHFIRQSSLTKRKRRSSLFDITGDGADNSVRAPSPPVAPGLPY